MWIWFRTTSSWVAQTLRIESSSSIAANLRYSIPKETLTMILPSCGAKYGFVMVCQFVRKKVPPIPIDYSWLLHISSHILVVNSIGLFMIIVTYHYPHLLMVIRRLSSIFRHIHMQNRWQSAPQARWICSVTYGGPETKKKCQSILIWTSDVLFNLLWGHVRALSRSPSYMPRELSTRATRAPSGHVSRTWTKQAWGLGHPQK